MREETGMEQDRELISVVVTSYNHAEYLEERMESLLGQSYPNLEIIVVDDCSTDDSLSVLSRYEGREQVRVVALQQNGGYANASNLGASLCRGRYLMFAECDDFSASNQIETLYRAMRGRENVGVAYSRSNMVDESGRVFGDDFVFREPTFRFLCARDTVILQRDIQRFFLISCVVPNMSAALIRKSVFERVGGLSPEFRACADWEFWCRISAECDFYYIAAPLNNFRTHQTSVRSTSGIRTPFSEIMKLLNFAAHRTELCFTERLRFRYNLGFIWASYMTTAPASWLKSFPAIWRESLRYDKASLLFLICGIGRKSLAVKKLIPGNKRNPR